MPTPDQLAISRGPERILQRIDEGRRSAHQRRSQRFIPSPIATASDIDGIVDSLRYKVYRHNFGYAPPLLYDENLPLLPGQGARRKIIAPEQFASAVFNNDVRLYSGSLENFYVQLLSPDITFARIPHTVIDPDLITTFLVTANLVSLAGNVEGAVKRSYTVYTTARGVHTRVPRHFLEQGLEFYNSDTLWTKRVLWFTSKRVTPQEWRPILYEDLLRQEHSIEQAKIAERQKLTHPFQGGLPSLGKSSR